MSSHASPARTPAQQKAVDWKKRFYDIVDKISGMEQRMTNVVYRLKNEALEKKREAQMWKDKYLALKQLMEEGESPDLVRRNTAFMFEQTSSAHEQRIGGYSDVLGVPEMNAAVSHITADDQSDVLNQSREQTVQSMENGRVFLVYSDKGKQLMVVQYRRPAVDSNNGGRLVWRLATGGEQAAVVGAMNLNTIKDVYVGKQTNILCSSVASKAHTDRCVSIIASDNQVDMEAKSSTQLTAWLLGLSTLLSSTGRQVVLDETSQRDGKRRFTILAKKLKEEYTIPDGLPQDPAATMIALAEGREVLSASPTDTIRMMTNGKEFKLHLGKGQTQKVLLFYAPQDEACGALYYCDPTQSRVEDPNRRLYIHQLSDIFVGKQTAEFGKAAAAVPDHHCFSLMTPTRSLNLEAQSEAEVTSWLFGINGILQTKGKSFVLDNEPGLDRRFSIYTRPNSAGDTRSYEDKVQNALDVIKTGTTFTAVRGTVNAPRLCSVLVKFKADVSSCGSLYCIEEGNPQEQRFGLQHLTDILIGDHHPIFKTEALQGKDKTLFFSLLFFPDNRSPPRRAAGLHLIASSIDEANLWVSGCRYLLAEGGQKVVMEKADGLVEGYDSMLEGRQFNNFGTAAEPIKGGKPIMLFYDPAGDKGAFYWNDIGEPRVNDPKRMIQLDDLSDIFIGKQHPHTLNDDICGSANGLHVWSLRADEAELHVEAPNAAVIEGWLGEVQKILDRAQTQLVVEVKGQDSDGSGELRPRKLSVTQKGSEVQPALTPEAMQLLMKEGMGVYFYKVSDPAVNRIRGTLRLLRGGNGVSSSVLAAWSGGPSCPGGQTQLSLVPGQTHLTNGNGHVAYSNKGDSDKCFHLVGTSGSVFVEADSPAMASAWVNLISSELASPTNMPNIVVSPPPLDHRKFQNLLGASGPIRSMDDLLAEMEQGTQFQIYGTTANPTAATTVFVFYVPLEASIFWCKPNQGRVRLPGCSIHLAGLTDIYKGKCLPIFEGALARDAEDDHVFSLKGRQQELHVEASTEQQAQDWLTGIYHLLNGTEREVELLKNDQPKTGRQSKRRVFSVTARHPKKAKPLSASDHHMQTLARGAVFKSLSNPANPVVEDILVFYEAGNGEFGSLFWCEARHRIKDFRRRIQLDELTDLFIGQRHSIWKHPSVAGLLEENSFSLISVDHQLHLVAPSEQLVDEWVEAIENVLLKQGQEVDRDEDSSAVAGTKRTGRRLFSVLKPTTQTQSSKSMEELIASLRAGSWFTSYGTMENPRIDSVLLRFDDSKDMGLGWLTWTISSNVHVPEQRSMPLSSVTDLFVGKTKAIFKSPIAMGSQETRSLSIVGTEGELNLEARSQGQVNEWVQGIGAIMETQLVSEVDVSSARGKNRGVFKQRSYSVATRRAVSQLSHPNPHVQVMMKGGFFNLYSSTDRRRIYMHCDPMQENLGTVLWTFVGGPGKEPRSMTQLRADATESLPLHTVTDLFIGKQQPVWDSPICEQADESLAWSLLALEDYALHLEAATGEQLTEWLEGIQYLLSSGGHTVVMDADDEPRRLSVVFPEAHEEDVAREAVRAMEIGQSFTGFGTIDYPRREDLTVFYERATGGKFGSLFWCQAGTKTKSADNTMLCHTLSDIYVGKQHGLWESAHARHKDEALCLSLITNQGVELHIAAESEQMLKQWLAGMNSILRGGGRNVQVTGEDEVMTRDGGSFRRRTFSVLDGLSTIASGQQDPRLTRVGSASPEDSRREIVAGAQFVGFSHDADGMVRKRQLFVFLEPTADGGVLHWCDPGHRDMAPESSMPLRTITDMFVGKQQPIFEQLVCKDVEDDNAFSLLAEQTALHLEANSGAQAATWVAGIAHALEALGQDIVTGEHDEPHRRPSVVHPSLASLKEGAKFNSFGFSSNPSKDTVWVWYDAEEGGRSGSICWSNVSNPKAYSPNRCLPIHCLTDIFQGKQHQIWKATCAVQARGELCMSLLGTHQRELHLEAENEDVVEDWMNGLSELLSNVDQREVKLTHTDPHLRASGSFRGARLSVRGQGASHQYERGMTQPQPQQAEFQDSQTREQRDSDSTSSAPAIGGLVNLATPEMDSQPVAAPVEEEALPPPMEQVDDEGAQGQDAVDEMTRGMDVERVTSRAQTIPNKVHMFYQPDLGSLGGVGWCPVGERTQTEENSLSFTELTDLFMGRRQEVFEAPVANGVDEERCFSMIAGEIGVHVLAPSRSAVSSWLNGIQHILQKGGQAVVLEEEEEEDGDDGGRRYSVMNSQEEEARRFSVAIGKTEAQMRSKDVILDEMKRGANFTAYHEGGVSERVFVFYAAAADGSEDPGSLYWGPIGQRDKNPDRCLGVGDITDIYFGKHNEVFQSPAGQAADESACISLHGVPRNLHLEAESDLVLKDWLSGINYMLSTLVGGNEITLVDDGDAPDRFERRDFSVIATGSTATAGETEQNEQSYAAKARDAVNNMKAGELFTRFPVDAPPQKVFVFYEDDATTFGSLYWCDPEAERKLIADQMLPLHTLTDLFVGRQADVFPTDHDSVEAHCFSMQATRKERNLHLEGQSTKQVNTWLSGIKHVLTEAGQKVISDNPTADGNDRRYSVLGADGKPPSYQQAQGVAAISAGANWTGFGTTQYPRREDLFVFYEPAGVDIAGDTGTIFWCPRGARTQSAGHSIALSSLTDLFIGKAQPIFQGDMAKQAREECCISFVSDSTQGGTGSELHAEASSEEELRVWLSAVNALLTHGGDHTIALVANVEDQPDRVSQLQKRYSITRR